MSTVRVLVNGIEPALPEGMRVLPILVDEESYEDRIELSGCGAAVEIVERGDGFFEIHLTSGKLKAHE